MLSVTCISTFPLPRATCGLRREVGDQPGQHSCLPVNGLSVFGDDLSAEASQEAMEALSLTTEAAVACALYLLRNLRPQTHRPAQRAILRVELA